MTSQDTNRFAPLADTDHDMETTPQDITDSPTRPRLKVHTIRLSKKKKTTSSSISPTPTEVDNFQDAEGWDNESYLNLSNEEDAKEPSEQGNHQTQPTTSTIQILQSSYKTFTQNMNSTKVAALVGKPSASSAGHGGGFTRAPQIFFYGT
jgi:hypothetical protein